MNLTYKLRKQKPDRVILTFPPGQRDPIVIDWAITSTREAMRMIRTLQWDLIEAFIGESVLFVANREEIDDIDDLDDDQEESVSPRTRQVNVEPDGDVGSWQVSPERWLRLLIQAQQSATAHMETTIKVILDTMTENNDRAQELLRQSHAQLVTQGDHIEHLIDQVAESHEVEKEEKENLGEKIEGIVEALAPVIVPLLMKMGQQAPPDNPPPPALPPARKKGT